VDQHVIVGEVAGAFGVSGWLKIFSYTDPPNNILHYSPWLLTGLDGPKEFKVISGRAHAKSVVAHLEGVDDRDKALSLKSSKITVPRDRFPPLESGQYYWADLVGLQVTNLEGAQLGTIAEMLTTGANDVIVAKAERERLIPFVIGQFIKEIKLDEGLMLVDWDVDF
jgi:16S rRNA processing protein RimM